MKQFQRERLLSSDPLATGLVAALIIRYPASLAAVFLLPMLSVRSKRRGHRAERIRAPGDVATTGRILLVALTGGLPLPSSLEMAATEVGPVVANELTAVLRAARREGMAAALAASSGPLTRPLFSRLALAQASGAPMTEAVIAFLAEMRAVRRGEALERARRLPVTLMIPLGLLILPGFIVLFVGPIVVNSLGDLFGSLP